MATALPITIAGPSGARLYGGRFGPATIFGTAAVGPLESAGELLSPASLNGTSALGDLQSSGTLASAVPSALSGTAAPADLVASGALAVNAATLLSGTSAPDSLTASGGLQGLVASGTQITTLAVRETAGAAGTVPYSATVLPLRGQVPSGQTITSPDDASMRASVLATHDDGSAALVVVAGATAVTANQAKSLRVQTAASAGGTALTTAAIAAAVSSVVVDFQGTYGSATLNAFGSPERTWWANPQVICCRYRLAAPTPGSTALEAVIDIHAYAGGRALVEVVVENSKMTSGAPTKPAAATYTGATVTVNGSTVATVSSSGAPEGNHPAFRAWYASTWVGGDPGVQVNQSTETLRQHPAFNSYCRLNTTDLSTYAADAYAAWSPGRLNGTNMGGTGDVAGIGPLPTWDAKWLMTGDHRAANAVRVAALHALSFNINYRDATSGAVTSFTDVGTRAIASASWPSHMPAGNYNWGSGVNGWEQAHAPAVGLTAFVSRPSPVFIEIAQKAATWQGAWSSDQGEALPDGAWTAGVCGYWYQTRGKAWTMRAITHATFITPSGHPWRAPAVTALGRNANLLNAYKANADNHLRIILGPSQNTTNTQFALFENWFLVPEVLRLNKLRLLAGAAQTTLSEVADWLAEGVAMWVNTQPLGGWRFVPYKSIFPATWAEMSGWTTWELNRNRVGNHTDLPPAPTGILYTHADVPTTYASYTAESVGGLYYVEPLIASLAAAAEQGSAGTKQAWDTVVASVTNWNTYLDGFAAESRWGWQPRSFSGDASAWDGGQGAQYRGAETFTTLQGVFNGISSTGGWAQLPGTNVQTVVPTNGAIDAIAPNGVMRQDEQGNFIRIWGGACWNGYGWFFVVPGGHFAGYRNDTYSVRLADPVGVERMHMPSPLAAVYRRDNSILQDPVTQWPSVTESNASSLTEWGPRGTHQYSGMVWDPATQKMFFGGDSQIHCTNPSAIGSTAQVQFSVYIFDPYAATPKQAWRRISVTGNHPKAHATGVLNNGNGTVSFRAGNFGEAPSVTYTIDLTSGAITAGSTFASPTADAFKAWRHVARDPNTASTYELSAQTWDANASNFAVWRTSGGLTKVADLPANCWVGTPYQDEQSALVIHNGKAYCCFQTGPGSSSGDSDTNATVQLGVHQVNLSTGAVQSFTSPSLPAPDTLYAGTSLNGLHGRFSFVPQVGAFVVMLSARDNVWVFRPPASWSV